MKLSKENKVLFYAKRGFLIGLIPLVFSLVLDLSCKDAWCGLGFFEVFLLFYLSLVPLIYLVIYPITLLSMNLSLVASDSLNANLSLFLINYSYPFVYALYGALIGLLLQLWRKKKGKTKR